MSRSTPPHSGKGESSPQQAEGSEGVKVSVGPLSLLLPPEQAVLTEARRLVSDRASRIEDIAVCSSQDPVIVIELLRVANAMFYSGARSPIASAKAAAIRLGADVVLESYNKLAERAPIADRDQSYWFEVQRARCRRASIVATILAEALSRNLTDECQVAGLFLYTGEMLAVAHLKEKYVKLATDVSRGGMLFRLAQDFKFDVEYMGINYLRRHGIPETILAVLDRDARPKSSDKAIMKPICLAAGEYVDSFDQNRFDKLAPGKTIPPKSALRTLQMTESQYLKVYERIAEFLFSFRLIEEKRKEAVNEPKDAIKPIVVKSAPDVQPSEPDQLEDEIESLLEENLSESSEPADESEEMELDAEIDGDELEDETTIAEIDEAIDVPLADFNLSKASHAQKTVPRISAATAKPVVTPQSGSPGTNKFLSSVTDVLDGAKTSEELLSSILGRLIRPGPFEKACIIVVSKDRKTAIVVAGRGPSIVKGQRLRLDDPLNPLAQCLSKVQSFGMRNTGISPFGSRAFAVAPIDADHDTPVALYADCGVNGALSFEARRIFRNVVQVLNEKLPTLPGGILNELSA